MQEHSAWIQTLIKILIVNYLASTYIKHVHSVYRMHPQPVARRVIVGLVAVCIYMVPFKHALPHGPHLVVLIIISLYVSSIFFNLLCFNILGSITIVSVLS